MKTRQFVFVCIFARQCGLHSADSTIVPPAMIWWSGAKFGKCCSQTSELSQWPSRRQNMFINKFSRKDHTLTWKRTNVLLRRSVQPCPTTGHCCLAPCKSVTNYGPLTEPKFCIVKCALTQIPTSNGHISETKRAILDPLVPKFSSDRGLSPTLSWKWRRVTLSPSFGLFRAEKPLFRGVPGAPRCSSLVRICPRACFPCRKKKHLLGHP